MKKPIKIKIHTLKPLTPDEAQEALRREKERTEKWDREMPPDWEKKMFRKSRKRKL